MHGLHLESSPKLMQKWIDLWYAQATQQELAEAHAALAQTSADLKDMRQESAQQGESLQAAMRAQADRAAQQLAQVSASLEEAQNESAQVVTNNDMEGVPDM